MLSLRDALDKADPLYILPNDPLAKEALIPAMKVTRSLNIMMGYFSSSSFSELAEGLASFLSNSEVPLRLIISPFITDNDFETVCSDPDKLKELSEKIFLNDLPDEDYIAKHSLECLAWLIAKGRIEIKIAVMKNSLFHSKVWLFQDLNNRAAVHGSMNLTQSALMSNHEQITVSRDWKGEDTIFHIEKLTDEFRRLWSGGDEGCNVVDLPEAISKSILERYKRPSMPSEEEFSRLWRKSHGLDEKPIDFNEMLAEERCRSFKIPDWLEYRFGDYSHQGKAVDNWKESGYRGILEMCTGSGKTLTAMIGAYHLHEEKKPLLIVVCAPYKVLISQWCDEIEEFGIKPINMSLYSGPSQRAKEILNAIRRLRKTVSDTEVIVVSNSTLCTPEFINEISKHNGPKLLIADECHNLGAKTFISNPPECFEYRLGLSATPIRQYDEDGTDALFKYFGGDKPCFEYNLEQAIGKCLTPYDYHVEFVELQDDEMDRWREISEKISKLSWKINKNIKDPYLENLYLQRRKILETASSKIALLKELIDKENNREIKYTLIYATDKYPEQLKDVNCVLSKRGIKYHQLTSEETANLKRSSQIIDQFQAGSLQVLTAKRVLDEGVNVPQIMKAYILASNTVKRQWVQRRGRLLRTCKAIGKEYAEIYDFVALPPGAISEGNIDKEAKSIVNSELDRVWEFSRLSRNGTFPGGPYDAVEKLRELLEE